MSPENFFKAMPVAADNEPVADRPTEDDFADILDYYSTMLSSPRMKEHYKENKNSLEELAGGAGDRSEHPGWTTEDWQELLKRVNELERD